MTIPLIVQCGSWNSLHNPTAANIPVPRGIKTEAAKVRHELDHSQEDFATMLGVSLATISKWERGTGESSGAAKTLLAVASGGDSGDASGHP